MCASRYRYLRKHGLIVACMIVLAQFAGAQEYFPTAADFARLYVGAIEPQYPKPLWHDIPYYHSTTDMYKGRISYHGVVYDDVQLRYDQLKQCVVVLPPGEKAFLVPEQAYVDWFEMDGRRYVHDPVDASRYASLLCDGSANGIRLYHNAWKVYSGESAFEGQKYRKTLSTEEQFTLVTPDGAWHRVKRASDVAKVFPKQKEQIRQFAKKNRLSFRESVRGKNLVRVVESLPDMRGDAAVAPRELEVAESAQPATTTVETPVDDTTLAHGIPVLDDDSVRTAVALGHTNVYVVPGAKAARVSLSDSQELDEIVVVGGRQSAVKNMMLGAEKFIPQKLKNIPSAFGESDVMKIVLTMPGVTTVGEASSGYNVRGGADRKSVV